MFNSYGGLIIKEIKFYLNGIRYTSQEKNLSLNKIIQDKNPYYINGNYICVIRKKEEIIKNLKNNEYQLITSKGIILISLKENEKLNNFFKKNYLNFNNIKLFINTTNSLFFGPINNDSKEMLNLYKTNISCKFKKLEVLLIDNDSQEQKLNLIFCKKVHNAFYGQKKDIILADIIGGYDNLLKLTKGDFIEKIEAISNVEDDNEVYYINDLSFLVNNEDRIYIYASINLLNEAPLGSELLYSLIKGNTFSIDNKTESYCSDNNLIGEPCEYENFDSRNQGAVSIRTFGTGRSRIYVYLKNRTSSLAHSIIGFISNGFELFKYSNSNTKITIKLNPEKINILGLSLKDGILLLKNRNISFKLENIDLDNIQEDEIIVNHVPSTTMEILSKKEVSLVTTDKKNIVYVTFYYNLAPKTIDFFKHSINLKLKEIGSLNLSLIYESTYIFNSPKGAEKYKELMPENIPKKIVLAGEIGVTNQAAKRVGYIGIKLEDSDLFGPTGEKFNATNIIGKILNPEKLKYINENDVLYIQEKK